jgi:hypothetical protein
MFAGNIFGTIIVLLLTAFFNTLILKKAPKRIDDE